MTDLPTLTEDRITRSVEGVERVFVFLNAYDRAELLRSDLKRRQALHAEHKQRLIENLKLAGISGEAMFAELHSFDQQYPESSREYNWFDWLNDVTNDPQLFEVSLKKTYNGEAEQIAKSAFLQLADKAKIAGVKYDPKEVSEDKPNPNSPTPAVYSTIPAPENSTGQNPHAS